MALRERLDKRAKTILAHKPSLAALQALVYGSPPPTYIKDAEGRYVIVNPAAASLFGFRPMDVEGKSDFDFLVPSYLNAVRQRDKQVIDMQDAVTFALTLEDPKGGVDRRLIVYKWPLIDFDHGVGGVISTARDVTDHGERRAFDIGGPGASEVNREIMSDLLPAFDEIRAEIDRIEKVLRPGENHLASLRAMLRKITDRINASHSLERRKKP